MNDPRDLYLGLLYPTEDYKVYGYVTNTKVKFVIVVESSNTQLRDSEIRTVSTHVSWQQLLYVCIDKRRGKTATSCTTVYIP